MTLEQAMKASCTNSAIQYGSRRWTSHATIVDGLATRRNPQYNEDHYWVQQPNKITRQHYGSLEEVKKVISPGDDWEPYEGE